MTLKIADNDELLGWILSFDGEVKVLGPDTLRQKCWTKQKSSGFEFLIARD
jgi:hypothetical protein